MRDVLEPPPLPPRPLYANKSSVGRVLVIGGSLGMAGAPALAARGALRGGAGLVTVAVPERIRELVASFLPEAMTLGLPCDSDGALLPLALPILRPYIERVDAVVLGVGVGRTESTQETVRRCWLAEPLKPLVLDADGLFALGAIGARGGQLASRQAPTVLTPHEGEAAALLGRAAPGSHAASSPGGADPRAERAAHIAKDSRSICVLKGPGTIVTDGDRIYRNTTGGPVLATGGSGDVLSGLVAAFLAGLPDTGGDPFGAACLAVHVHGAAADRLAAARGDRGVLSSEIADAIPEAIREFVARGQKP